MAAVPAVALNGMKLGTTSQAFLESKPVKDTKALISELCRQFYNLGWVGGTGGSITIKVHDDSIPKPHQLVVMSPSGACFSGFRAFLLAECYHYLFDAAIKLHQLGLDWTTPTHGPIQNTKGLLGGSLKAKADANHEIEPLRRCIVLDIEGTTTPISFVSEVLFPYARANVGRHLSATYDSAETQDDIKSLRTQVEDDLEQGVVGAVPIPPDNAGKEEVIAALVANVEAMIKADRKITALKQLQGHIWRTGFENNELEGEVFEDVPEALEKWHALGIKVYIYSSGSRLAQRLIFGNTSYGDLRKYLSGFFDTRVGNKRETRSYVEISESVGVDKPSEILFVTDVYQEAVAAKAAGLEVLVSIRPGNAPLPDNHGFKTVKSFSEI